MKSYQEMDEEQSWRNFEDKARRGIVDMKLDKVKKGVNRREFLMALGIFGLSGKVLSDILIKEYNKHLINRIYNELPKHTHLAETKGKWDNNGVEKIGYGIIYKNHYFTQFHITDTFTMQSFMGNLRQNMDESETRLYGKKLERIAQDEETDVSIFKLPTDLSLPDFPCKPSEDVYLGQDVYLIGHPQLENLSIRGGKVIDLNGWDKISLKSKTLAAKVSAFLGTDISSIGGDSGAPLVSSDFKLLGMHSYGYFGNLGYDVRIKEYLKHIK